MSEDAPEVDFAHSYGHRICKKYRSAEGGRRHRCVAGRNGERNRTCADFLNARATNRRRSFISFLPPRTIIARLSTREAAPSRSRRARIMIIVIIFTVVRRPIDNRIHFIISTVIVSTIRTRTDRLE